MKYINYELVKCASSTSPGFVEDGSSLSSRITPNAGCTLYNATIKVYEMRTDSITGWVDITDSSITNKSTYLDLNISEVNYNIYIKVICDYKYATCYSYYCGSVISTLSTQLGFDIKYNGNTIYTFKTEVEIKLDTKGRMIDAPIQIGEFIINPNSEIMYMKDDITINTYGALDPPSITIDGSVITIVPVSRATGYKLYIDGTYSRTITTTSIDIDSVITTAGLHYIYFTSVNSSSESAISNIVTYTKVAKKYMSTYGSYTISSLQSKTLGEM